MAIVGATGAVGTTALQILSEDFMPLPKLYLVASARSAGRSVRFTAKDRPSTEYIIEDVASFDFSKVQLAIFSAGSTVSQAYARKAAIAGCIVIDNTSYFRYDPEVPLVVSEVNPERIRDWRKRDVRIIANPNCSTMQIMVALKPLHDLFGIQRYTAATYQAVSGAGTRALSTLAAQNVDLTQNRPSYDLTPFTQLIAGNVIPHIDKFMDNGYTKEEMKVLWETRKILGDDSIAVSTTCVRIPVDYGHSVALHIETKRSLPPVEQIRGILSRAPGLTVIDGFDGDTPLYPTPRVDAAGTNTVYVGRIRKDISHPYGLAMWVVADNLRKGAALNALQIAKWLIDNDELR